ncbi:MAG: hypothetical protein WAK17_22985 [Candidatus Nitrosopolaris sp.]|jgi:hypothetical protein
MYVTNGGENTVYVIATTTPVQPPTHTTITSAVDGNGNHVQTSIKQECQTAGATSGIDHSCTASSSSNSISGSGLSPMP